MPLAILLLSSTFTLYSILISREIYQLEMKIWIIFYFTWLYKVLYKALQFWKDYKPINQYLNVFLFFFAGCCFAGSKRFLTDFLQEFPTPGTGPYFDNTIPSNITGLVGKNVHLVCKVKNLGNKTVSFWMILFQYFW